MIILTADDYAMTDGVSRAIEDLARARRLSATSAMVTMPGWREAAPRIAALRGEIAIGLHLNLTVGAPLGPMPKLAPDGIFPSLKSLLARSLTRLLPDAEIAAEIGRQLDLFESVLGFPPDHIDGHQHVQVLPTIRRSLIDATGLRYTVRQPLLRNPSDRGGFNASGRINGFKAATVNILASGFARAAVRKGFPINDGFDGFSSFDTAHDYADELTAAFGVTGKRAIVMCHPGFPDEELGRLDPVVARRRQEYDTLMRDPTLPGRIWHPDRASDGPAIDWSVT